MSRHHQYFISKICSLVVNIILYSLVSVSFLSLLAEGNDRDFNCPDECGLYAEEDRIGPRLHEGCSVMGHPESVRPRESLSCNNKFTMENVKKWNRKRKRSHACHVGGRAIEYAKPWMVDSLHNNPTNLYDS